MAIDILGIIVGYTWIFICNLCGHSVERSGKIISLSDPVRENSIFFNPLKVWENAIFLLKSRGIFFEKSSMNHVMASIT